MFTQYVNVKPERRSWNVLYVWYITKCPKYYEKIPNYHWIFTGYKRKNACQLINDPNHTLKRTGYEELGGSSG